MKAKYLRAMEQPSEWLIAAGNDVSKVEKGKPLWVTAPAGTEIEHPDAYVLVKMGVAVPSDDECKKAANMTDEEIRKAAARYNLIDKGLDPAAEGK